jgi:hypothetical protein
LPLGATPDALAGGRRVLLAIRPEALRLASPGTGIAAEVEEVVFGGATTRVLVRTVAAPDLRLDLRLAGDAGSTVPAAGDRVDVTYDPADAVVVPA